jgi:hypothetical protein
MPQNKLSTFSTQRKQKKNVSKPSKELLKSTSKGTEKPKPKIAAPK